MHIIDEIFLTEAFSADPKVIADAVNNKRVINIYYKGGEEETSGWRTIEPCCYGEDLRGRQAIRAFQPSGKTTTANDRWKFFLVERIKNWNVSSNKNFDKRPLFNEKGDAHMRKIFAISDFKNIPTTPLPKTTPNVSAPADKGTPEPDVDIVAKTPVDKLPDLSKVKDKKSFYQKVIDRVKKLIPSEQKRREISIALRNKLFEAEVKELRGKDVKTLSEIYEQL